jgi:hypothetical protein
MTLTQITLMHLPLSRRTAAEMSLARYERVIRRRLWTRRLKAAGEIAGCVITLLALASLMWAFAALTPPQMSAEADLAAAEIERTSSPSTGFRR